MPAMIMKHEVDPKEFLLKSLGDISNIEIFNNQLLVATYKRPAMTVSGIIIPETNLEEDRFQSKVGLIIKMGNSAFVPDDKGWFNGIEVRLHDWVVFRPSDGWSVTITNMDNPLSRKLGIDCRILDDVNVKGRISDPDYVW